MKHMIISILLLGCSVTYTAQSSQPLWRSCASSSCDLSDLANNDITDLHACIDQLQSIPSSNILDDTPLEPTPLQTTSSNTLPIESLSVATQTIESSSYNPLKIIDSYDGLDLIEDVNGLSAFLHTEIKKKNPRAIIPTPANLTLHMSTLTKISSIQEINLTNFNDYFPLISLFLAHHNLDYPHLKDHNRINNLMDWCNNLYPHYATIKVYIRWEISLIFWWYDYYKSLPTKYTMLAENTKQVCSRTACAVANTLKQGILGMLKK